MDIKRAFFRVGIVALFALSLTGCVETDTLAPSLTTLVVHAVIDADARTQLVEVEYNTGFTATQTYVKGAHVTITTPSGRILTADQISDTIVTETLSGHSKAVHTYYRISLDKYNETIVIGGAYQLHVKVNGYDEVTGTTVIPAGASTIATQTSGVSTVTGYYELSWARTQFARAYELVFNNGAHSTVSADTSTYISHSLYSSAAVMLDSIAIIAVDANYYDYYRHASDFYTGTGVINRLNGAVGVFGSFSRIKKEAISVH